MLNKFRQSYSPEFPKISPESVMEKGGTSCVKDGEEIKKLFPKTFGRPICHFKRGEGQIEEVLRVGVVFSGGPAAGGHNVIAGLFDALKKSKLYGFLDGPQGIIDNKYKELTQEMIFPYRNQGGFDLIGSGRIKIETEEQLAAALRTALTLNLDGLVIIGGDDSNTNAAVLAEYFLQKNCKTKVIGVPKTIDGDLRNDYVTIPFGFDTACKVYSEMIGNLARDALSAKKYWHFVKLMGRSASHIALECAIATQIDWAFIGEEGQSLEQITNTLVDLISKKPYGVILIPEGLIEFIPHLDTKQLPEEIQKQLATEKDPHGNIPVSAIETEKLLIHMVKQKGVKMSPVPHFFGYEGRCSFPSNFDANYCYTLGMTAAFLIKSNLTGYMAFVKNLTKPPSVWEIGGIPITMLLNLEERKGKMKPVIQKALVDLKAPHYLHYKKMRANWAHGNDYLFPGPIQFFGPKELTDSVPLTLF